MDDAYPSAPSGYQARRVKKSANPCDGCAFNEDGRCIPLRVGFRKYKDKPSTYIGIRACTEYARRDGIQVNFKVKSERKPREWMAWAVIWRNKTDNEPSAYLSRAWARGNCGPEGRVIRVKITEVLSAK